MHINYLWYHQHRGFPTDLSTPLDRTSSVWMTHESQNGPSTDSYRMVRVVTHGGQLKRYKDNLKNILNQCGIPLSDIESLAKDRTTWRTTCSDAVSRFEDRRVNSLKEKRVQLKEGPPVDSDFQCVTCGRMCRSRIGLFAHTRTHRS